MLESGHAPPSVSDYALVRRQFHIFERALKKFKSDVGLWIQYIQVAKREGARALVGRITARFVVLSITCGGDPMKFSKGSATTSEQACALHPSGFS